MEGMRSAVSGTSEKIAGTSDRLRRRVYQVTGLQEVFNDSNVNIVLKSSREKTVPALSALAVKEGQVVKLNDSGAWRRRHALVVPHTFLYYFGERSASTDLRPHGVIDLELYTDVKVVDDNVVRLAPSDEHSPIRTFYLRLSDSEEAEAWAQAIRDARFDGVREERDALRSAKDVLTEQLLTVTGMLRTSEASLKASQRREAATVSELARSDAKEARRIEQVQALLASARDAGGRGPSRGAHGDDFRRHSAGAVGAVQGCNAGGGAACALSEMAALGEAIAERAREVAELKIANETLRKEAATVDEHRRREASIALSSLNEEREHMAREWAMREGLEGELQTLRCELEENRAAKEEARANLGAVASACRQAEAKARELQEHRRVLAREVKASRAEQRRLSAALACATTAAATAAATVAANTESANSRDRSSSTVGWVAGNEAHEELDTRRGGEEGARGVEVSAAADDEMRHSTHESDRRQKPSRGVILQDIGEDAAIETMSASGGNAPQGKVEGDAVPPALNGTDATVRACNLGTVTTLPRLRLMPLDVPSTSPRGIEDATGAESGATSPEACSPVVVENYYDVQSASQPWKSSSFTEPIAATKAVLGVHALATEDSQECAPVGVDRCGNSGPRGAPEPTGADGEEGEQRGSLNLGAAVGLGEEDGASASASAAAATVVGESFNQMVQSFSAGLRESRRAKRTPLLGSLDGSDADDGGVTDGTDGDSRHDPKREEGERSLWSAWSTVGGSSHGALGRSSHGAVGAENSLLSEGGSEVEESANTTMPVLLDDSVFGEPKKSPLVASCAPCSRERGNSSDRQQGPAKDAAYSHGNTEDAVATSVLEPISLSAARGRTEGGATSPPTVAASCVGPPDNTHAISDPSASTVAASAAAPDPGVAVPAVRAADGSSSPTASSSGWRDSLEAAAEAAGAPADWLRNVGRRDGEEAWQDQCSSTSSPSRAPKVGDTLAPHGGVGGGSGVAIAAAAAAAAERGGRVSLEAAAAARRWEAKFKGSLISMAGGVRWGMGPQRMNDV